MTVCNVSFTDDAVSIYSDTLVYIDDDPVRLCRRKVEIDPDGRFSWATRGSVVLGDEYDTLASQAGSVEVAAALAREWLARLTAEDLERYGSEAQEVILAGWSASAADLVTISMRREAAGNVTVVRRERGVYLQPTVRAAGPALPKVLSDAQMIAVAHAQKRFDDATKSGLCIGGVMWRHVITRDGVTESIADLYGDYDYHARRFGDPNADEVAHWRAERAIPVAA